MTKEMMLYDSDETLTFPSLIEKGKVYSNEDNELYLVTEHQGGHYAYPLLSTVSKEPLTTLHDPDYFTVRGEQIMLGAVVYSANFGISNITWKEFKADINSLEIVVPLEKGHKQLKNEVHNLLSILCKKDILTKKDCETIKSEIPF